MANKNREYEEMKKRYHLYEIFLRVEALKPGTYSLTEVKQFKQFISDYDERFGKELTDSIKIGGKKDMLKAKGIINEVLRSVK